MTSGRRGRPWTWSPRSRATARPPAPCEPWHDRRGARGHAGHRGQGREAMIVAAAICPSPPLLATELTGQADILPELRTASAAAVARLLAAAPEVVAVVGPAETTAPWDPAGQLSLAAFAPA